MNPRNTYVIGDIHGDFDAFNEILKKIKFDEEKDVIYILGDVIDYGLSGISCLQMIMNTPAMHMILGNHEWMMLRANSTPYYDPNDDQHMRECVVDQTSAILHWYDNGGIPTHRMFNKITDKERISIIQFLLNTPINIDIKINDRQFKLCHAAPIDWYALSGDYEKTPIEFAIWHRSDFKWSPVREVPYTTIIGHTPTSKWVDNKIPESVSLFNGKIINIDCGSDILENKNNDNIYTGRLACICLNNMKITYADKSRYCE